MGYRVFFTIVLVTVAVTFGIYSLAAHLDSDSADAQTTWQYERFENDQELRYFLESLSSDCRIDWESLDLDTYVAVAYSCPD